MLLKTSFSCSQLGKQTLDPVLTVSPSGSELPLLRACTALLSPVRNLNNHECETASPTSVLGPLHELGEACSTPCPCTSAFPILRMLLHVLKFVLPFVLRRKQKAFLLSKVLSNQLVIRLRELKPTGAHCSCSQLSWPPGTQCSFPSALQVVLFDHFAAL